MKKVVLGIVLVMTLVTLVACQNNGVSEEESNDDDLSVTENDSEGTPDDGSTDLDESTLNDEKAGDEVEEKDNQAEEQKVVEALYEINQGNWRVQPIDESSDGKVALLTIDDAPDKHAVEMAHILYELEVPAIFFVNGHFLETEEKEEQLKEIVSLGFTIGNHTYNHPNLRDISVDEQRDQLVSLNDKIEEIIGERPKFFRAPFGANTEESLAIAKEEKMVVMNWTYGYDWEADYQDSKALADIMVNTEYLSEGANLLMHDREWTKEALEDIVTGLREKGYTFVSPEQIKGVE
ncbi:hypothetical protein GCM10012290_20920 [Halolactibacillus alkaliphilus]|uniref:NodB homology domain-containing protein n=1 Tax=Halolactibacillus alkaliphilus TaxID=442899 RepID=A0A511X3I2_9BACI|nr:polysaccharide deacetylase family protein [Halolactibacillus alkaliphilus]GEN57504.1 hypothetical protein HAL01_19680 [Halolactibacillus alkaliphilus]GGN73744.1 hypothetical protein GCM10012290_20920 [Halolactibacillus alkaliphilus]SFO98246.1 Peptidoglycan/xylan/chitin deacetylase, PgdA/CDA1 family [Halolactibacillus alkaliphilus]